MASYYLALYFQDNRTPSPLSWRVFDVAVNDQVLRRPERLDGGLDGVWCRVATLWADQDHADARAGSPVGPVINAAELMTVVPLRGRTHDVISMEALARGFVNPPPDWSGDPCLPLGNSCTGVSCTQEPLARVTALWLVGNSLTGPNPDTRPLHHLASLYPLDATKEMYIPTFSVQQANTSSSISHNHMSGANH